MARINYTAILKAIRRVIAEDADVRRVDPRVEVNAPIPSDLDKPFVAVYEGRREPTAGQDLAAGTRTRYAVYWEVQVHCFSGESQEDAGEQRDELLGLVEIALMRRRNLGGALEDSSLMLRGGPLGGGAAQIGFISSGSLTVTAEAVAST